ncbi:hypothetical protein BGZ94_008634 [Podila epigama]|nr:hypothetical protein BGZ94_008634 [Podila epigama]
MSDTTPTLFTLNRNYSTWSLRVWLAMRTLGINFKEVQLVVGTKEIPDFGTPASNALLARAGPTGKAPALHVIKPSGEIHIVFESLAIIEFLAEEHPSLWPADKFDRAYARSLAAEMATGFQALRDYHMIIRDKYDFDPALYTETAAKNVARMSSIWEELRSKAVENKEKDKGFLFGEFTALDAMYAPVILRMVTYSLVDKLEGTHAKAYVKHILNTPEVREWIEAALTEKEIIPSDEKYPPHNKV